MAETSYRVGPSDAAFVGVPSWSVDGGEGSGAEHIEQESVLTSTPSEIAPCRVAYWPSDILQLPALPTQVNRLLD